MGGPTCEWSYRNHLWEWIRKLIFTNNKPQKSKEVYDKVIKELNEKYESNFPFSVKRFGWYLITVYRNAKGLVFYRKPPLE